MVTCRPVQGTSATVRVEERGGAVNTLRRCATARTRSGSTLRSHLQLHQGWEEGEADEMDTLQGVRAQEPDPWDAQTQWRISIHLATA